MLISKGEYYCILLANKNIRAIIAEKNGCVIFERKSVKICDYEKC